MIFLLSPARSTGQRAAHLLRPEAAFPLAQRVRAGTATLGEVFAYCSGLYLRGKLAYARRFGGLGGALVLTPNLGLVPPELCVGLPELRAFAEVSMDEREGIFAQTLVASAAAAAARCADDFVLLGSIATAKYVGLLLPILGPRLLFPRDFTGRGDLSRGGLLLRRAASGEELEYVPVEGAMRKGPRPEKLGRQGPSSA